jgi:hypothetical protein
MAEQRAPLVAANKALDTSKPKSKDGSYDSALSNGSNSLKDNNNNGSTTSILRGPALSSCIVYSFCSVSMVLANKSLASR